ncbi:Ribonuclease H2 subunit B [Gryllus bimaculatus]|nr:Ribonuclease H2 subunit B [Gryllus bimaculatus]
MKENSGDALDVPEGTPDIVQLRHPQSGNPAMFLFSPGDGMVQEVLTFSENRRSWFIEDTATHIMPLDQLLKDDEFPETERLLRVSGLKQITQIADRKGDEELNAFKYNEEKALNWLHRKAERVAEVLKQKGIHVGSGAVSNTFIKSSKQENPDQEAYLKYAHGILSEYLAEDLSQLLLQHMGLPEERPESHSKRKLAETQVADGNSNVPPTTQSTPESPELKKPRTEEPSHAGVLDLTKPEKASKPSITAKDKARAKSATGSKNIANFFKKK